MQKKLSARMRIFASLFAVLFLVGAVVQWNDPDPYIWIAAYALASSLSVAARSSWVGCAIRLERDPCNQGCAREGKNLARLLLSAEAIPHAAKPAKWSPGED